jgi:ribosomal protein L27
MKDSVFKKLYGAVDFINNKQQTIGVNANKGLGKAILFFIILLTSFFCKGESKALDHCNQKNDCYQDWKEAQQCIPECTPCLDPILKATNYTGLIRFSPSFDPANTATFILHPTLYIPLTYVTDLIGKPTFTLKSGPGIINGDVYSISCLDPGITGISTPGISYSISIDSIVAIGNIIFDGTFINNQNNTTAREDYTLFFTNNGLVSGYNAKAASENAILSQKTATSALRLINLSLKEQKKALKKSDKIQKETKCIENKLDKIKNKMSA